MATESASYALGSPGYTLAKALGHASENQLAEVLGAGTVALLKALDPTFSDLARLREAASTLIEPMELLGDPVKRQAVISALPIAKAEELASRVGLPPSNDPYEALLDAKVGFFASGTKRDASLGFFGLERPGPGRSEAIRDSRPQPGFGLFEHQHRAAVDTGRALSEAPFRVLLHMPTGAGKTRTAMHVIARHMNGREHAVVCWLAQSQELLEQAADEFERCWSFLGSRPAHVLRCWGDNTLPDRIPDDAFVVGGYAKLASLLARDPGDFLRLADSNTLTVVDEAHQAVAPTYGDVIETLTRKNYGTPLLGLSATPGRTWADIGADAELSAFFGNRKVTLRVEGYPDPVRYLIDRGYLARPHFRTLNGAPGLDLDPRDLAALGASLELPEAVLSGLAEEEQRNLRILAEVQDLSRRHDRIIVFATTVAHSRLLAAVLNARGVLSFSIDGTTDSDRRRRSIKRFRSEDRRPMVMCNFGVLTTGFDAPRTSAAIIARPTRSLVLYSQMVGRATRGRQAGGNDEAEIVTVVDPALSGFGDMSEAFMNWEDVWDGHA